VGSHLGQGAFGSVFEVFDERQQMTVALKLLDPNRLVGTFPWREPVLLTKLEDRHVLRVWNAGIDAGIPFVVTELAPHGTLHDQCGLGVAPGDAVTMVQEAARGVQRTHDGGVLHRDIKLENLFVADDGHVMLGDFGIADPMDANGLALSAGSPFNMAPELLVNAHACSVVADVYSLGTCLYRLLTGFYPYLDLTQDPQVRHQLAASRDPTPVRDLAPHVGRGLGERVERSIARDPADRYQSAAELDNALGQVAPPERRWTRVPPTPPSVAQWDGHQQGHTDVEVCCTPNGRRFDVEARYVPSGRRVPNGHRRVPERRVAQALRVIMANVA
jgi:serine/threonine-protein kinase